MRTVILILSTMLLTACDVVIDKPRVWHDDQRFVTCYLSPYMESIHCIPDNQLPSPNDCKPGTVIESGNGFPGSCVRYR